MLSILIPIYNYNAAPLVKELRKQCMECDLEFEIICIDDCSTLHQQENQAISGLEKCFFQILDKNIGRSKIRNLLAAEASYKWLLFLDCDTYPAKSLFILNYVNQIKQSQFEAIYGGLQYQNIQPKNDQMLRWVYGKEREAITVLRRQEQPYKTSLASNFLIQKSIFTTVLFNETISSYGYEDSIFIQTLQHKNLAIDEIENPVFHLNLETSSLFLSKTKEGIRTLFSIQQTAFAIDSKIIKTFKMLKKIKLVSFVAIVFHRAVPILEKNLVSKKPSLFVFDLYKIGYFCYLNHK